MYGTMNLELKRLRDNDIHLTSLHLPTLPYYVHVMI